MIGKPHHYPKPRGLYRRKYLEWDSACGIEAAELVTTVKKKVNCLRCRKTKAFKSKDEPIF